jgi:hypothetical protein
VTDDRVFEERFEDPRTPTLGFGGSSKATADVKARAIGRKGSIDMPLGDVLLAQGQTVAALMADHVAAALGWAGYRIATDSAQGEARVLPIDVHVKRFWSWSDVRKTVRLSAIISASIDIVGRAEPLVVTEEWSRDFAVGNDDSWIQMWEDALRRYRRALGERLDALMRAES